MNEYLCLSILISFRQSVCSTVHRNPHTALTRWSKIWPATDFDLFNKLKTAQRFADFTITHLIDYNVNIG